LGRVAPWQGPGFIDIAFQTAAAQRLLIVHGWGDGSRGDLVHIWRCAIRANGLFGKHRTRGKLVRTPSGKRCFIYLAGPRRQFGFRSCFCSDYFKRPIPDLFSKRTGNSAGRRRRQTRGAWRRHPQLVRNRARVPNVPVGEPGPSRRQPIVPTRTNRTLSKNDPAVDLFLHPVHARFRLPIFRGWKHWTSICDKMEGRYARSKQQGCEL